MTDDKEPQWLNPKEAAKHLDVSERTLADWRFKGKGPAYSRMGERLVRYRRADLDAWVGSDA